jgi:serine/threonine protein kinase
MKQASFTAISSPEISEDSSLDETRTGTKGILGTTAYMSPEQATGGDSDARSDIFSFGVVLYEMFAGKRPFDGNSPPDIIQKILMQPPPPLSDAIPPALRNIVEKALEKEPADRYQSMREMVVDLRRVHGAEIRSAIFRARRPTSRREAAGGFRRSHCL